MYVQHKIEEQGQLVWKWIDHYKAWVLIAGYVISIYITVVLDLM